VAAVAALSALLPSVPPMFQPFQAPFGSLPNPLGTHATVVAVAATPGWVLAIVMTGAGTAGAFVRLRRASGDERQQLKLLLSSAMAVTAATVLEECTWLIWPHGGLGYRIAVPGLTFAAFAVATGVAMLRYRLYGVDIVINRGLVYATLTVLLAAAYGITALLLATGLGSGSTWATAGATLVVAIAFRPLRAVVQDAVDRRFARARYDALRRVQAYLEDLRAGRASPEAIEPLLRELLADPTLELRFFLPESHVYVDGSGCPVAGDDGRERTLIERGGAPMAMVLHRPTGPQRPDLLRVLVEAGGLAIEIARLHVEVRRQLTEVEASRARIVAAGYAERRRIERDLHDGAQQRLVSIGLELRHVQHQTGADLDRAIEELTVAIDELRELAQGLPPSQLDAGLEPALRELAGRSPLPVEVRATGERFSTGLEATAYFIACEGLTNAIKHARASTVMVSAHRRDGRLVVSVRDDGIGGATDGSGIRGLRDRVATHGGALHVESASGTTLTAELPCGS
jgi:signal transduction histidine kinase